MMDKVTQSYPEPAALRQDIADELRYLAGHLINGAVEDGAVPVKLLCDAADEIERLSDRVGAPSNFTTGLAALGIAEVVDSWATLESHGFPPETMGWPEQNIGGQLPAAIDAAITALVSQRETLLAEVLPLRAHAQGWHDISTAPKDGTEIIGLFYRRYDETSPPTIYGPWTIAYDGRKWRSSWDGSEVIEHMSDFGTEYKGPDIEPTHWQPLPDASSLTSTQSNPDKCAECGYPRAEHSYNGACYGICGKFVSELPSTER